MTGQVCKQGPRAWCRVPGALHLIRGSSSWSRPIRLEWRFSSSTPGRSRGAACLPAASAAARTAPGQVTPQPPHLAPAAVPASGLPRPCGGRPRSPAPARAAASGLWPSSGCSPVPRPERSADPGTALGPRGARGRLGSPERPGRGAGRAEGGSGPAPPPTGRGGAAGPRRPAGGLGAPRGSGPAPRRTLPPASPPPPWRSRPGRRRRDNDLPRGRTAQASPAGSGDRGAGPGRERAAGGAGRRPWLPALCRGGRGS